MAQKIKNQYADRFGFIRDHMSFTTKCEDHMIDIDQDWDNEITTYFFNDSCLLYSNDEIIDMR